MRFAQDRARACFICLLIFIFVLILYMARAHANTQKAHADVLQKNMAAVSESDRGIPDPVLAADDVAAFYPCYQNPRAAEEVMRRFRTIYPNAPAHMWMDSGGSVHELRRVAQKYNASFHVIPPRLGFSPWATSYQFASDFLQNHWRGIAKAAESARRVLVLEDDTWVLRPLPPIPDSFVAVGGVGATLDSEYADRVLRRCLKAKMPIYHTGSGGTQLSSSWVLNQTDSDATRAADIVLRANKVRIPADKTVAVMISCGGGRVMGSYKAVTSILHTMDGFVDPTLRQNPHKFEAELEAVRLGEVSVLHKIRLYYD